MANVICQLEGHLNGEMTMGDRGNIIVKDDDSTVYLYSHWSGSDLPDVLKKSLERGKGRWDDGSYLTRIIFCDMVAGHEKGETGFGISSVMGDGGTDITVNVGAKTVTDEDGNVSTFDEYIA